MGRAIGKSRQASVAVRQLAAESDVLAVVMLA